MVFKMPSSMDTSELSTQPYVVCQDQLGLNKERIIRGLWTPLNKEILTSAEDNKLRLVDPEDGDLLKTYEAHTEQIQDMQYNAEKTLLLTASERFY